MTTTKEVSCIVTGEYLGKFCVFIILTDDPTTVEEHFESLVEDGGCTIIECNSARHADNLARLFLEGKFYVGEGGSLVGDETPEGRANALAWTRITNCIKAGKKTSKGDN